MTTDDEIVFSAADFDADQLEEIRIGREAGLDVSVYARKDLMAIQMHEIRLGMEAGFDVSIYASPEFDWFQMEEIRKGMEDGVDYRLYANPALDYSKMRQIRKGLRDGINLLEFQKLDAGILKELRKGIKHKVPIVEYIKEGYVVEQLEQIRSGLEKKLNIRPYLNKAFRGAAIREIVLGLEHGINPMLYSKPEYGWQQMRELRFGLEKQLDVSRYSNSLYGWQQMQEIRLGLEEGLDVDRYRSFMYSATDMKNLREQLLKQTLQGIIHTEKEVIHWEHFVVTVSDDEMEAYLEIKGDKSAVYEKGEILAFLKKEGICEGILEEAVEDITVNKKYYQNILVAKGRAAQKGADGRYEYFFNTNPDRKPQTMDDGSVDYRDISWFEPVVQGQTVAKYHSAENGIPGRTVYGNELYAQRGKEQNVLSGSGFLLLEDGKTYVAAVNGKVELRGNHLEITRLLVLENASLSSGRIQFDGCVYVCGNVGSGSAIQATEDIIVDGFVEAAFLESEGNILLRQGVNGAGGGKIQAGGNVIGKFFEATTVIAKGDIQANYSLNCNLISDGQIEIHGRMGRIAGGTVCAAKGVTAYHIGNKAGISTILKLGLNDHILHELGRTEKSLEEINRELAILGNAYINFQRSYPPEVRNTMEMYLKIESALYTKELQLDKAYQKKQQIEQTIQNMEGARAVILGELNEGTVIYIDNQRFDAFWAHNVTVRKKGNKIAAFAN